MISEHFARPDGLTDQQWHALLQQILQAAENATPVKTGEMRESWDIDDQGDGADLSNHAPHAEYVQYGNTRGMRTTDVLGKAMRVLRNY